MTGAKHYRILSIDGGGIQGIVAGQVLVALEKKLRAASGNDDARLADFFDMMAGTSTGGMKRPRSRMIGRLTSSCGRSWPTRRNRQ